MVEGLRGRDVVEGLPGAAPEGASRSGEHEPAHLLGPPAVEALVERAVLAVDGEQAPALGPGLPDHELARHDEGLLVGEGHVLPRLEGAVGRYQAHGPHRRRDHQVGVGVDGHVDHPVGADADGDAVEGHEAAEGLPGLLRRHGDRLGPIAGDLLGEALDVRPAGEAHHGQALREGVHDPEHIGAHRAGTAEYGEAFHGGSEERPLSGPFSARRRSNSTGWARRTANCRGGRASPVTREERARVLDPRPALEEALVEVADDPKRATADAESQRRGGAARTAGPSPRTQEGAQDAPGQAAHGALHGLAGRQGREPGDRRPKSVAHEEGQRVGAHDDGDQQQRRRQGPAPRGARVLRAAMVPPSAPR